MSGTGKGSQYLNAVVPRLTKQLIFRAHLIEPESQKATKEPKFAGSGEEQLWRNTALYRGSINGINGQLMYY